MSSSLASSSAPSPSSNHTASHNHKTDTASSTTASSAGAATSTSSSFDAAVDTASALDFIGSSHVVKDLFSLPYAVDRDVSVAVHNLDGTLVIDADHEGDGDYQQQQRGRGGVFFDNQQQHQQQNSAAKSPRDALPREEEHDETSETSFDGEMSTALVALSNLELDSEALTIVNSLIGSSVKAKGQQQQNLALHQSQTKPMYPQQQSDSNDKENSSSSLGLPLPEEYVHQFIPPCPEPREYLSWRFNGLNLLVGSEAIIYRSSPSSSSSNNNNDIPAGAADPTTTTSTAAATSVPVPVMAVRVEEAQDMKELLRRHEDMVRSGLFLPDHQFPQLQQRGKQSYADATRKCRLPHGEEEKNDNNGGGGQDNEDTTIRPTSSFSAPDLQLQTCIVTAPNASVGHLLTGAAGNNVLRPDVEPGSSHQQQSHSSPVSTVLDAYLDNIIANVPQLALCLKEKGFISSVKLLNTDEIPSGFMHASTFDTSSPFEVLKSSPETDRIFSPQIMNMNAAALLRFLKTNCTRDNATYLLRRKAGQTKIQLYDISSISTKRQRKWIWWLAMMSYRFAIRLRHLSQRIPSDNVLNRSCRARQRSLLQNTLDLLELYSDIEDNKHESLVAAICENLADTFLNETGQEENDVRPSQPAPATSASTHHQPYNSLSVNSLSEAQDHLKNGIKVLRPVLQRCLQDTKTSAPQQKKQTEPNSAQVKVVLVRADGTSSDSEEDDEEETIEENASLEERIEPVVTQLFGLQHKFVNVSLKLAELHLRNYYSSSAMQTLRAAARGIADSLYLLQLIECCNASRLKEWLSGIQLQHTWLWEHCGHFSRSFAGDGLWRDRGHISGEDIISVLQEAENAFANHKELDVEDPLLLQRFTAPERTLFEKSNNAVDLNSLSGVVNLKYRMGKNKTGSVIGKDAIAAAEVVLDGQTLILRERRKVLVAACIAYCRAIDSFRQMICAEGQEAQDEILSDSTLLLLLRQRLGDACNEIGKIFLNELRRFLASDDQTSAFVVAEALLSSALFWFFEACTAFEQCKDLRNLSLLRCNLCQAHKLRANAVFAKDDDSTNKTLGSVPTHAELCLTEAADHLQAAHESLGERDIDPATWDMVSEELAATFLVLGVRRRQSLIGSGSLPVIMQTLRLSPGKEHSIVDPMERALSIYEQLGNYHQTAAVNYQLALYYSKIWTCQLNEAKTREKLGKAFHHFNASYSYFSETLRGNEITFCLLSLDLSSLYASVSSEECTVKALMRCLDTFDAFSKEAIESVLPTSLNTRSEWFNKMGTLASSVDDRVFKLLRTLVAETNTQYPVNTFKGLYRSGLQAKMSAVAPPMISSGDEAIDKAANNMLILHSILKQLGGELESIVAKTKA